MGELGSFIREISRLREAATLLAIIVVWVDAHEEGPGYPSRGGNVLPDGGNVLPDGGNVRSDGGNVLPDGGNVLSDGGNVLSDGGNVLSDGGNVLSDGRLGSTRGEQVRDGNRNGDGDQP